MGISATAVRHQRFFANSTLALLLSVIALSAVVGTGILRAFTRGGSDFSVFYTGWRLVLAGRGLEIYHVSPDRFLYSPGFAWGLAPLAWLSPSVALGLWCALKVIVVIAMLYGFVWAHECLNPGVNRRLLWVGSLIGMLSISKPLLIDFEYGQVNFLVLGSCVFALFRYLAQSTTRTDLFWDWIAWMILAFLAVGKLFPLPLLFVPWFVTRQHPRAKLWTVRLGIMLGCVLALVLPVCSVGWGVTSLWAGWLDALLARGLPLESHNQSFTALLHHFFSGSSTEVRSSGSLPLYFGSSWISFEQIALLARFWTFSTLGLMMGWLVSGEGRTQSERLQWVVVLIGFLIIPSHLVWKPYFVMSAPLLMILGQRFALRFAEGVFFTSESLLLCALFVGINFTGFDFIGPAWGAYVEAASFLLLIHLILMYHVATLRSIFNRSAVDY